ncbi:hypothetical protein RFI_04946 [Reticulomyxa filosa]|uniref:Uncharacterized protein n=1 Tax=Reticulomyxa filosa TaxID=46433 RepID=X6P3M2_RETFI|nr:hypothetical protein RFI_04946 [Reticulomyxa filosa]|eukprot:ETO32172.1 hypothetical protein RFI_04946 [Reticulomyxa filosa]
MLECLMEQQYLQIQETLMQVVYVFVQQMMSHKKYIMSLGGNAISVGSGNADVGTMRTTIANDNMINTFSTNPFEAKINMSTGFYQIYSIYNGSGSGAVDVNKPEGWVSGVSLGNQSGAGTVKISNIYVYDNSATVTSGKPNRAIATIPAGTIQKAKIGWIYIPAGFVVYIHGLRVSVVGNTTSAHRLTLRKYFVNSNASVGISNGSKVAEWLVKDNYYYDYKGRLAIRSNDTSDQMLWFEANFTAADSAARIIIDCEFEIIKAKTKVVEQESKRGNSDFTFSKLKSMYKSKYQSDFHNEGDSDYFDGPEQEDEQKDNAGGPIERNPFSSRSRYPGKGKQARLIMSTGERPIEINSFQHKIHRFAVKELKNKKMPRKGSKKGTYEEVFTGVKLVTKGGLTKEKLYKNSRGKIVSLARHNIGKNRMQAFTRPWDADMPKSREHRDEEMGRLQGRISKLQELKFEEAEKAATQEAPVDVKMEEKKEE